MLVVRCSFCNAVVMVFSIAVSVGTADALSALKSGTVYGDSQI